MEVAGVVQGSVITSGGSTYVADKLTITLLGFTFTQRQLLSAGAGVLLGVLLTK